MAPSAPGEVPPILVISLERSSDRREKLKATAGPLGIPLTFVPAVDGRAAPPELLARYAPAQARRYYGRELRPGELGCCFSHERAWRQLLDSGQPWVVILEDDPVLDAAFLPAVRALAAVDRTWDLIRLAGYHPRRGRVVAPLADGRQLVQSARNVNGSNAYALSRSGAKKLLAYTATVVHPVDNAIDRIWENGLDLYAVRPFPVREDSSQDSTIRTQRSRTLPDPAPLGERAALRARTVGDSLRRRWHNLRKLGLL